VALPLSAFPKCYLDEISSGRMNVFDWIESAKTLDADGLEMYEGFFTSLDDQYIDELGAAIKEAGFAMPMLCCSPNFTAPDETERKRQVDREIRMVEIAARLGGHGTVCRVLSGQRYPDVSWEAGRQWVIDSIRAVLPAAREHGVVLGFENHYKDGNWRFPEFAQKADRFISILNAVEDDNFGVQYDPSNALVAGDEPIDLLRTVASRVVSMHASDRYLEPGATLDDIRGADGAIGYSPLLKHGVTGKGLNDYDAIFSILSDHHYRGWISIEDGMNGMEEMAESLGFLRAKSEEYFGTESR
jgi:sugar phosphate isomerase/epimerase